MGPMIPYFPQPEYHLFGPLTIHAFGTIVAVAVIVGWRMVVARTRAKGLDPELVQDLLSYVVLSGFVVAHLYSVLAYFPREVMKDPLLLLKFWEDISSFGGFVGGLLGLWLFFRFKGRDVDASTRLRYLDGIAYAFPFAWAIGRVACSVAHDHPGTITTFPLGISLESPEAQNYIAFFYLEAGRLMELPPQAVLAKMAFHDLGWYEFLYTLCLMVPAFLLLDRKPRIPAHRRCQVPRTNPRAVRGDRGFPRRDLLRGSHRPGGREGIAGWAMRWKRHGDVACGWSPYSREPREGWSS
jgi:prolipoprotein diacylglyceryltransferase